MSTATSVTNPRTIDDLRQRLFDAIDGVKAGTTTVEQGKTIGDLAQVIVNTAKVEIDYARVANREHQTAFIPPKNAGGTERITTPSALPNGITAITRHTLCDE